MDEFKIINQIGMGGFGLIYSVKWIKNNELYAEKCIIEQKNPEKYNYYIIMELGEKDWEREIIMRSACSLYYSEYELFEIIKQLVKTLSLMQKNNITHRDIKPQNILI